MDKEYYCVRKTDNGFTYAPSIFMNDANLLKYISNPIRIQIMKAISAKPMYPIELAKQLDIHEQTIYYHIKAMQKGGFIEVADKKEIRGTIAKRFKPVANNIQFSFNPKWSDLNDLLKKRKEKIDEFLEPFIQGGELNAPIIVGSPDPHGPLKSRARDGHYASDLALFLGSRAKVPHEFLSKLDVDVKDPLNSMIILGGPVANLLAASVNETLPVRFSDEKPFGLISTITHKKYSDEHIGLIARIPNPRSPQNWILLLAGISVEGTKSAVIGLTRFTKLVLQSFTGQKSWCRVVQGFDLDADGSIDSVEILE